MTEHEHQKSLFTWAAYNVRRAPELDLMYAIPNAGKRTVRQGAYMKAEGLKAGVPDICLPVARQGYSALYIELKQPKKGRMSDAQTEWQEKLSANGNLAVTCYGWEEARDTVKRYLGLEAA
jgi:hypothetical protein